MSEIHDWLAGWLHEPDPEQTSLDADQQLGDLAIRYGWITPRQLDEARAERDEVPLGAVLLRRRLLHADQIAYAMSILRDPKAPSRKQLGRYQILGELGRGGMGRVYRAIDPSLRREVALKVLADDATLASRKRFEREAAAMARLTHRHIVPVHEFGEDGGVLFLAMDLLPGPTLEQIWAKGAELRARVEMVEKVAQGISFAHEHGVVHRDLKPSNVQLDRDGEPRVLDFGLARLEGDRTKLTETGSMMGTPLYMAPEAIRGDPIGEAADIYALGVLLYEAIAGRPPYLGSTPHEVYARILDTDPPRPSRVRKGVPPELEIVALKALEKQPRRRYRTARDFGDDIARWLRGDPIRARPTTWMSRVTKRFRRNPTAWLGVGGAMALLVAAVILGFRLKTRERAWNEQEQSLRLSAETQELLAEAEKSVEAWKNERYLPPHPVSGARSKLAEALPRLRRVVEAQPDAHAAWSLLGWALLELRRDAEAAQALEHAVALAPDLGAYRFRLGQAYANLYRREFDATQRIADPVDRAEERKRILPVRRRAEEHFDAALRSSWPGGSDRLFAEAYVRWTREDFEGARKACDELAKEAKGGEEAYMLLGLMSSTSEEAAGWYDKAAEHARSLAAAWAAGSQARSPWAERLRESGRIAEADRMTDDALARAETAIRIDPDDPAGWMARGMTRSTRGDHRFHRGENPDEEFRAAVDSDLRRAAELEPDGAFPCLYSATTRIAWGYAIQCRDGDPREQYRLAMDDAARAAERDPRNLYPWFFRGRARMYLGMHLLSSGGDAAEEFRRAIDEDFAAAIERGRDHGDPWLGRAQVRVALGVLEMRTNGAPEEHYRGALDDFTRALERNPERTEALRDRAMARVNLAVWIRSQRRDPSSELRLAVEDLEVTTRLEPGHPDNWSDYGAGLFELALSLQDRSLFERSEAAYSKCVELNVRSAEAWMQRGRVRMYLGRPKGALADFEEAVSLRPSLEAKLRPLIDQAKAALPKR